MPILKNKQEYNKTKRLIHVLYKITNCICRADNFRLLIKLHPENYCAVLQTVCIEFMYVQCECVVYYLVVCFMFYVFRKHLSSTFLLHACCVASDSLLQMQLHAGREKENVVNYSQLHKCINFVSSVVNLIYLELTWMEYQLSINACLFVCLFIYFLV